MNIEVHDTFLYFYSMKLINSAPRYKAVGPYSQAVLVGDMLYCSGVIGIDRSGTLATGLEAQLREIFLNISDILSQEGLTLSDVVKTTNFLVDISDFAQFNVLYAAAFGDHRPVRSTVQVAGLPKGALLEVEVIACSHLAM